MKTVKKLEWYETGHHYQDWAADLPDDVDRDGRVIRNYYLATQEDEVAIHDQWGLLLCSEYRDDESRLVPGSPDGCGVYNSLEDAQAAAAGLIPEDRHQCDCEECREED